MIRVLTASLLPLLLVGAFFASLSFPLAAGAQSPYDLVCTSADRACPDGMICMVPPDGGTGTCTELPDVPEEEGEPAEEGPARLTNVLIVDSLPQLIVVILEAIVMLGSMLLVLMIIYVGFLFVQAQGAEEQIKQARQALLWTVVGGMLLLGAQALAFVVQAAITTL